MSFFFFSFLLVRRLFSRLLYLVHILLCSISHTVFVTDFSTVLGGPPPPHRCRYIKKRCKKKKKQERKKKKNCQASCCFSCNELCINANQTPRHHNDGESTSEMHFFPLIFLLFLKHLRLLSLSLSLSCFFSSFFWPACVDLHRLWFHSCRNKHSTTFALSASESVLFFSTFLKGSTNSFTLLCVDLNFRRQRRGWKGKKERSVKSTSNWHLKLF